MTLRTGSAKQSHSYPLPQRLLQSPRRPHNDEREEIFATFYDLGKRGMCHQGIERVHPVANYSNICYIIYRVSRYNKRGKLNGTKAGVNER